MEQRVRGVRAFQIVKFFVWMKNSDFASSGHKFRHFDTIPFFLIKRYYDYN